MTLIYWIFVFFMFGLCIIIHELGHLYIAIKCGLKPERFSVGFGPKIWGFEYKGVEYILSAIPFGGYVSLPQLEPSDQPTDSKGNVLPAASPIARLLTAFAGPMANIILGFLLAIIVTIIGSYRRAPQTSWQVIQVPEVVEPMENEIGLKKRDKLISVNGQAVHSNWSSLWSKMTIEELNKNNGQVEVKLLRQNLLSEPEIVTLKVQPQINPEFISGLRKGDTIVAINGKQERQTLEELLHDIVLNKEDITLTINRDGKQITLPAYKPAKNAAATGLQVPHFSLDIDATLVNDKGEILTTASGKKITQILAVNHIKVSGLTQLLNDTESILIQALCPQDQADLETALKIIEKNPLVDLQVLDKDQTIQTIKVKIKPRFLLGTSTDGIKLVAISPNSPAQKAGLQVGDKIIKVNQYAVSDHTSLTAMVQKACEESSTKESQLSLTVIRDDQPITVSCGVMYGFDFATNDAQPSPLYLSDYQELWHPSPWQQFSTTMNRTIQTFKALFANKVRAQDMSGPIGIFQMTYLKVKNESFRGGLAFIIMISFSLAFFNLLPLPVLDGGHITFSIIEIIIRRRLPIKLLVVLQTAFAILLISFALYVTYFDIARVLRINGVTQRIDEATQEEVSNENSLKIPNKNPTIRPEEVQE